MKIKRLLSLAMLCIAWVGSAWADTTLLTEANGWQKVTDLSSLTLSDYYFAFVDNDKDLMLSFEEAPSQSTDPSYCSMVYRTGARAELKHTMLWILEENASTSGAHLIKSAYYNDKFLQTEGDNNSWYCRTHDNGGGNDSWGAWKFAYADSKWSIENGTYSGNYVGPWSDGAFQNGMQVAGNKKGNNVGYFQIYAILRTTADGWQANASKDNPADITFKITNPRAVSDASGWTATGANVSFGRNNGTGTFTGLAGFFEPSNWGSQTGYNFTVTQTIADLPAGKYKVRAAGQNSSGNTLTLDCGGDAFTYQAKGTTNGKINKYGETVAAGSGVAGWEWGEAYHTLAAEGSLTITFHTSASTKTQWANYDNVELYYYGNGVELVAEAKNAGETFTTEAGKWYVIPVATNGEYIFTVGDKSNVTYTQKGNTPESGTFSTASNSVAYNLTEGYVYLKTEAATSVKFDASSYTYTVGSATNNVSCIQPGQKVTISYNDAVTNDPNATFEKLGTVTFNETAITPVLSGKSFTFTVPEGLETSKEYTLSIAEGAFGYDGEMTCAEQTITFTTPAVFDGTYFVKAADGTYISRGAKFGTEAARDPWGIAMNIATDGNNVTTFTFIDNEYPLGMTPEGEFLYTDNKGLKLEYTLSKSGEGYTIKNIACDKYVSAGDHDGKAVALAATNPYVWTLVAPAEHATEMATLKESQAVAAANSAVSKGATRLDGVTGVETLKNALLSWPEPNAVELPALNSTEFYQASGTRSAEVTITKAGLYKFSMPAYNRPNNHDKAYSTYKDNTDALTAYIFIGDTKTQVRSLYSEEGKTEATGDYVQPAGATQWWPNQKTTGTAEFDNGKYVNEVWVWLEAGTYSFGISHDGTGKCGDWVWFGTPTLTLYSQNLYPTFAELYEKCKPWTESTAADDYVATYNSYASYADDTDNTTLQEAINYLKANFDTYAWDNASMEHPYLVEGVISRSDCTTNGDQDPYTDWAGSGRRMTSGQHWSGDASRQYFRDVVDGAARSQTVKIPKVGTYLLKASVRVIDDNSYAIISVGDESVERREKTGSTGGTIAIDGTEYESVEAGKAAGATFANSNNGFGWIYNKLIFCTSSENEEKKISINLSHAEATPTRIAECGGMFLYYIGQNYDKIEGNTHYYYGSYATAPSFEVTEAVPVVDATKATVTGATVTRTNPNGLVYLASGSTADGGNNVVVDGTCANLVLTDGHPFTATKSFTATNASYKMTAIAGDKFGTLMLPFAVTTLPGKAYSLDADLNVIDGSINGSEVTKITANSPVLVTAAGNYAGSNVDIAVTDASKQFTNGNLTGVYQSTDAPVGSYVLQNHDPRGVAFYLVQDVQPTVKPFRAFIPAQSSNVKSIKILFDGETTGISSIDTESNAANETIYDLSGRKVNNARKGVYIINGKKIVK